MMSVDWSGERDDSQAGDDDAKQQTAFTNDRLPLTVGDKIIFVKKDSRKVVRCKVNAILLLL